MNKRHYEHTLPNIRGSLSNTYNRRLSLKRKKQANNWSGLVPLFFAIYPRAFLRSRSILSHPPLYLNDCSLFWFTRSHPLCGWLWVNQKREVPNVGGIAMVIIRSFGIAETTSFFRIAVPSFYRLSRQSVANPFPPATCGREIGIRFCKQNRMVCFTFRTALFLVFCLP